MTSDFEKKWQERWKKDGIFEPAVDESRKKFLITVPWPYTSGSLHVGHGRTYTLGDIIARYKRLRGYNVLFPMGFHQSGTPVLSIAQKILRNDKSTLSLYTEYLQQYGEMDIPGRLKSFTEPSAIAEYFSNAIINDFTLLGFSIDWSRRFTSAEPMYQDFVSWQFNKLNSKGFLTRGDYPLLYSVDDQNPVGEDDIKDGDTDKVTIEEFTAVKFNGRDFSMVAASLRPETIYGITNLWVSPNGKYYLVTQGKEKMVVSGKCMTKLKLQGKEFDQTRDISFSEMMKEEFEVPITGKKVKVRQADFVDPDNASGVVYSVPAHSIMDYMALKVSGESTFPEKIIEMPASSESTVETLVSKFGIKSPSDSDKIAEATQLLYKDEFYSGIMNGLTPLAGKTVQEARSLIREQLIGKGLAFILYETSRKAETRSGSEVLVAVVRNQWFIDYSRQDWKEVSHLLIESMSFYPEYLKRIFHDSIDWLRQRPCARKRGLGTRLPMDPDWVIESLSDSTIYPAVYTNAPQLRSIYEDKGSLGFDLVDSIFSGSSYKMEDRLYKKVIEAKRQWNYWYGVDLRLTTSPHISNHLSFYIMNHAALFSGSKLPRAISISGTVTSKGAKIGKSKGNVVSLLNVVERYSADIYRLFVAVGADISTDLDWNEDDVGVHSKKIDQFVQLMESFSPAKGDLNYIEEWFISSFYSRLKLFTGEMDQYGIRHAYISIFHEVMNDLKYLERRGGRINIVLQKIMKHWLIALSPVIPHLCEEYWHKHVSDSYVSLEVLPAIPDGYPNEAVLKAEEYVNRIIQDIREIMKATGIEPKKIQVSVVPDQIRDIFPILAKGEMSKVPAEMKWAIPEFMKIRNLISQFDGDEYSILESSKEYLESTFDCKVSVSRGSPDRKSKNAWPGRPLIRLE
ncbi:MAG: leucine--tRNA ligase [Thermoplasmata archaeon]